MFRAHLVRSKTPAPFRPARTTCPKVSVAIHARRAFAYASDRTPRQAAGAEQSGLGPDTKRHRRTWVSARVTARDHPGAPRRVGQQGCRRKVHPDLMDRRLGPTLCDPSSRRALGLRRIHQLRHGRCAKWRNVSERPRACRARLGPRPACPKRSSPRGPGLRRASSVCTSPVVDSPPCRPSPR